MRVLKTIRFNLLRDGDRHLRGRIAEEVFSKVKDKLLQGVFMLSCNTHDFDGFYLAWKANRQLMDYLSDRLREGASPQQLIAEASRGLDDLRSILGISVNDPPNLEDPCILCLGKGEVLVHLSAATYFGLCKSCLQKCLEQGYVKKSVPEATQKLESLKEVIKEFTDMVELLRKYRDHLLLIHRLTKDEKMFLYKVYGSGRKPYPFDFIAIGEDGSKYLIDVTSVKDYHEPAGLTEREELIAKEARRLGFKILIPVVRFDVNWSVVVELREV